MGSIPVIAAGNSTLISFPAPAVSNNQLKLKFEYAYDIGLSCPTVRVFLDSPLMSLGVANFGKVDGVIHIIPEMLSSYAIDLIVKSYQVGPPLNHKEVRKNADGSFDVYFSFEDYPDMNNPNSLPLTNPQPIVQIVVNGLYNISQGGLLHASLVSGRWTLGPLSSNPVTYQLNSVPADIHIPGHELCDPRIKITGEAYKTVQDCSSGIRYVFTHNESQAIELSRLAFQFTITTGAMDDVVPGAITSTVPFAQSDGHFETLTNGSNTGYFYIYEHNGPIFLESGMFVDIPFEVKKGCATFYVSMGEAIPVNGANGTCALDVSLGSPLCDPKVFGKIMFENGKKARDYRVRLETIPVGNYELEENTFCQEKYSFCPDPTQGPFRIRVLKQPNAPILCGVTTYDCVLISREILGIPPSTLDSPYKMIAANADLMLTSSGTQGVTTTDVTSIRKCILGVYPNDFGPFSAPSWWYIRESLNLDLNPLLNSNYETANTVDVPTNGPNNYGNFFAVKVGDVNLSCADYCRPGKPDKAIEKKPKPYLSIEFDNFKQVGNTLFIPIMADAPFSLIAAQAGFRFDPQMIQLKNVIPNLELPIGEAHFGRAEQADGALRFAWDSYDGYTTLPKKGLLFTLEFELNPGQILSEEPLLWISDNVLESLVYSENGTVYPVRLNLNAKTAKQISALGLVVSPNPFQDNITAIIYAENPCKAVLRLTDNKGFTLQTQEVMLKEGDNAIELQANHATQPGVYFLSLEAAGNIIQRRVVKLQ